MDPSNLFAEVLEKAISEVKARQIPVFTFAFYHDHESAAVSVCVDTEENSNRFVVDQNRYNMGYFLPAVANGELTTASLWQANVGRSLSLGDFHLVNVARTEFGGGEVDEHFYVGMVRALVAVQDRVAQLSPHPERLVFVCSGADDEAGLVWALPTKH